MSKISVSLAGVTPKKLFVLKKNIEPYHLTRIYISIISCMHPKTKGKMCLWHECNQMLIVSNVKWWYSEFNVSILYTICFQAFSVPCACSRTHEIWKHVIVIVTTFKKTQKCSHLLSNCQIKFPKRVTHCFTAFYQSKKREAESSNNNQKHEITIVQDAFFQK